MNYSKGILAFGLIFVLKASSVFSQIVDASPETQTICSGANATLTAIVTPGGAGSLPTTSYAVSSIGYAPNSYNSGTFITLTDDSQSAMLPIGFTFCFFGTSYTQFYIGSNGWVAFSPQSTSYTSAAIPSSAAGVPMNCVMGPWQDWHPGTGTGPYINYQTLGVAPNRRLVVSWNNCPMYSCTGNLGRFQIVLYESTNIIENYIASKPNCTGWAGGTSVQGVHNATGTVAYTVPGRNSTAWTATNEGWRYTPNGVATYTINWYVLPSNTLVGTGSPITVTPPAGQPSTSYYAAISGTTGCGAATASTDTVVVLQNIVSAPTAANQTICSGTSATLTASGSGAVYNWYNAPGGTLLGTGATYTTPVLTTATNYYVQSNVGGCVGPMTTVSVSIAPGISVNAGTDNSICSGASYTLGVTPVAPGNSYSWSAPGAPGFSTSAAPTVSPASTTTYSVMVTNASGCTGTDAVTITVGTPLTATATGSPANCSGACDGAGNVIAAGSFGGYTYSWTGGTTASTVSSLCAGTYSVTVTDIVGCTAMDTIQVIQPAPIVLSITATASTCGQPNGSATVVANGGSGGHSYLWTDMQTTPTATNLLPGSYCVVV
ncbi:MAG TPA: hypothetical protein VGC65_02740, partial [Bacteroidia bacterium]